MKKHVFVLGVILLFWLLFSFIATASHKSRVYLPFVTDDNRVYVIDCTDGEGNFIECPED